VTALDGQPSFEAAAGTAALRDGHLEGRRVLLVSMYYAPELSGSAPYTTDLAEHLARCGAVVDVVTTQPHYPQWRRHPDSRARWHRERLNGVSVHRVPCVVPAQPDLAWRAVYEASFVAAAARRALTLDPDVVIGCSPTLLGAWLATTAARLGRLPLLQWVQDVVSSAAAQSGLAAGAPGAASHVLGWLEGRTLRQADVIALASEAFREPVDRLTGGSVPLRVIRNWSRLQESSTLDGAQLRRGMGWGDRTVVLHTGNLGQKQGLDELVPRLRDTAETDPDILFAFVGDGNQRRRLEGMTRGLPNVRFHDPVSESDYPSLLRAADVLLLHERSSVVDMSLPSKLTSYVASGVPVLGLVRPESATGLDLRAHKTGMLLAPGDRDVGAAVRSLAGTDLGRRYGEHGLRYFRANLAPERSLHMLQETLGRLVADPAPSVRPTPLTRWPARLASTPLVTLGLPVYQESADITRTLQTLAEHVRLLDGFRWEMVVVDDGSRDGTPDVVERWVAASDLPLPVRLVRHARNQGLGAALQTVFSEARGDAVITLDADLSYDVEHIGRLLAAWRSEGAAVVTTSPYMRDGRLVEVPRLLALRSRMANRYLAGMSGKPVHTFTAMVRLYDGDFARSLPDLRRGPAANVQVLHLALRRGLHVTEIPATLDWSGRAPRRGRTQLLSRKALAESWRVFGDGVRLRRHRPRAAAAPARPAPAAAQMHVTTWQRQENS
jgi:glycosyltransferase involved in cell wall biosynthesis